MNTAIDVLVGTLYGTVEPARVNALREMYLLSLLDDPQAIREKINSYLSEGPVALILDKVVRLESTLSETLKELSDVHASPDEWAGAATRYLDAYAEHPVLLVVRSLGEAWQQEGTREEFDAIVERLVSSLATFGLDPSEQTELLAWMLDQLREYFGGKRWAWAPDIWNTLEKSAIPDDVVESLEGRVLDLAAEGLFNSDEVSVVVGRRLTRATAEAEPLVQYLTSTG
jgi:hypothetical protein